MTVNADVCPWYLRKPAKIIVSHICSELAGSPLTNRIISSNGFVIQTCLQSSFKENRVEVLPLYSNTEKATTNAYDPGYDKRLRP